MKQRLIISAFSTLIAFTAGLTAGPIEEEYNKVVEEIRTADDTPENRKIQLERTLNAALTRGLTRYFSPAEAKDAKLTDYEKSDRDPYLYFFRYNNYIGFFRYNNDPEKYFSFPIEEQVIKKPENK